MLQDTDPPQVTGSGPDTKTVDRYLTLMTTSSKLQKLSIPVSLTTSAVVAQDLIVYVKPELHVDDALVSKVSKPCNLAACVHLQSVCCSHHQPNFSQSCSVYCASQNTEQCSLACCNWMYLHRTQ